MANTIKIFIIIYAKEEIDYTLSTENIQRYKFCFDKNGQLDFR